MEIIYQEIEMRTNFSMNYFLNDVKPGRVTFLFFQKFIYDIYQKSINIIII